MRVEMGASMDVRFLPRALKDLRGLTPTDRQRVTAKIDQYAAAPATLANNVKALVNSDLCRLRVGDWRVLFSIEDGVVTVMLVHRVRHRREAYD